MNTASLAVSHHGSFAYEILFGEDFRGLQDKLSEDSFRLRQRRVLIVSDGNVLPLYGNALSEVLAPLAKEVVQYAFIPGEEHKQLDALSGLYAFLIDHRFDRHDLLIALGGGVVGDMCGFAAASYLRGVDYIQIPTTLLSQCDSSIGGKTAVDFRGYKNMIGAFYMPKLVYMNMRTLDTLDGRQFISGFAEVMKDGLIKDEGYYSWLLENKAGILAKDPDILCSMIRKSCMIKREVVERDPEEKGERALLNFGHSIGHAVEKASGFTLLHGECVAIGAVAAAFLSFKRGHLKEEEYARIKDGFSSFGLPISCPASDDDHPSFDADELLRLTHSDKKRAGGRIRFILLHRIGDAFIDESLTDDELLCGIREVLSR